MRATLPSRASSQAAEAAQADRPTVEPEDALLAMLGGDGIAARVLHELGATPDGVRKRVQELRGEAAT